METVLLSHKDSLSVEGMTEEERDHYINSAVWSWKQGIRKIGLSESMEMMKDEDQKNHLEFPHLLPLWKEVRKRVYQEVFSKY